eukprot:gene13458-13584_t
MAAPAGVQKLQTAMEACMDDLQKRFERCLMRCDDTAREPLPHNPGKKDISKAQEQQLACMDACGSEYLGKVPKLKADMSEDMKRLDQGY